MPDHLRSLLAPCSLPARSLLAPCSLPARSLRSAAALGLSALGLAALPAQATVTQLTSASQLSSVDTTALYTGVPLMNVPTPYQITGPDGNVLTFSLLAQGQTFTRLNQGTGYGGDFPSGTPLLFIYNNPGPTHIAFAQPVTEFGLTIENGDLLPNVVATFSEGSNLSSTPFSVNAVVGSVSFLGLKDTTPFTSITLNDAGANGSDFNVYGISQITYRTAPASPAVPEPSFALLGLGLPALGVLVRRRVQKGARPNREASMP